VKATEAKSIAQVSSVKRVPGGPEESVGGSVGGNELLSGKFVPKRSVKSCLDPKWKNTLSALSRSRQDPGSPKPIAVRDFFSALWSWLVPGKNRVSDKCVGGNVGGNDPCVGG